MPERGGGNARSPGPPRAPDFYIAGQPKSGTTALYEMLRRHPQIFMPALKEPMFFAPDLRPLLGSGESGALFPATYEEYLSLFAPAGPSQVVGEASVSYLRSRVAAQEIARVRPDARIVAVLREPASLLRSLHLQRLQEMVEDEPDLGRAIALEPLRREGEHLPERVRHPQMLLYTDFTCYVEQLQRFEAHFAPEQMLVLLYDDFRADNAAAVRRVLRFLDVDDSLEIQPQQINPTVGAVRSRRLWRAVQRAKAGRGIAGSVKRALTPVLSTRMRKEIDYRLRRAVVHRSAPAADERVLAELRRALKPQVEALGEHIGRDVVSLWRYDSLA